MSCCTKIIKPSSKGIDDEEEIGVTAEIRPGESMDCFMRRAGDSTGLKDDKTDYPPNKIATTDIPLTIDAEVGPTKDGLQFELTPQSTATNLKWSYTPAISGITMSDSGKMTGTFPADTHNKKLDILVTVTGDVDGVNGTVDERTYTISPAKTTRSDVISFIHPLPGARVTSKFGPRKPPASGASSKHGGVDFAMPNRSTIDVLAAADGVVEFTGNQPRGAGNYIKVKHFNTANKHLCTTVYMHLARIYVSTGQQVVAGQKIGHEGNTGIGTGAHLHFECRLPDGTKIDPLPLINGTTTVYKETNPDNTGKEGTQVEQKSDAVLTPPNVDARSEPCPEAEDYPKDPNNKDTAPIPPADITDPFKKAWFFTMTHEVNSNWNQEAAETDDDIINGRIDTPAQRKKVGYVNNPKDNGGETKFGISKRGNPSVNIKTLTYKEAESIGFNNYWNAGSVKPSSLAQTKPKSAGMLFDMNYINGPGGAASIYRAAGVTDSMSDEETLERLYQARRQHFIKLASTKKDQATFKNGWLRRADESYQYFKQV